nr:MAG TPA: hypothetical protein [Caudoviricetes sp.]
MKARTTDTGSESISFYKSSRLWRLYFFINIKLKE